ncbi:amidohydrolase-domain-containing protein [Xylaria castorea]|nr:amidohydrolase-domain-containing protein [Xylaria castorea]
MANSRQPEQYDLLNRAIDTTPIIDHHAHPLLKSEFMSDHPLLSIASEANGDALQHTSSSLAHIRAVKQLAQTLGCEQTWDAVASSIAQKRATSSQAWIQQCLDGIETILVDDGLGMPDKAEEYSWHDSFTKSKCKRIVRIESVAEDIIAKHCVAAKLELGPSDPQLGWSEDILFDFRTEIERCIDDPEVAGFKSIKCYRGGLDIVSRDELPYMNPGRRLDSIVMNHAEGNIDFVAKKRLQHGAPNHLIIHETANIISESPSPFKKPLQFHTGLGDNDIDLAKSSPSWLQTFIREYPTVPIVLLHAGYPWVKEMGYLAAMYSNVYADIGEVFPAVSRHGQENVVKQILELCPWEKILWSTDGHSLPETYLLATTQVRSVLKTVLAELVQAGDLDEKQAITLAQDVLFMNAKKLYNLSTDTTLPSFAQLEESQILERSPESR